MIPAQDLAEFNNIINRWAAEFAVKRRANVQRKKLVASGSLKQSVDDDIHTFSTGMIAEIVFKFNFYGKFYDFKKVKYADANRAMVTSIQEWIRQIGVSNFSKNERYNKLPSNEDKIKAIGWAVAKSLSKKAWKPRKWFNTNRRSDINKLEKTLLDKWSSVILTQSVALLQKN